MTLIEEFWNVRLIGENDSKLYINFLDIKYAIFFYKARSLRNVVPKEFSEERFNNVVVVNLFAFPIALWLQEGCLVWECLLYPLFGFIQNMRPKNQTSQSVRCEHYKIQFSNTSISKSFVKKVTQIHRNARRAGT